MDIKKLQEDINERNFKEKFKEECKILVIYVNNKNKTQSVVIEMLAEKYKYVKEDRSRIFVGYQRCKIFDLISVKPCYNCARYGYSGATCKNTAMCTKCSMPHMANLCSETVNSACANCKYSNGKYKTSYDINHEATDSELCEILKSKVKYI